MPAGHADLPQGPGEGAGVTVAALGPGDENGDGLVDDADVGMVLSSLGKAAGATRAEGDLDADGDVDDGDLTAAVAAFGASSLGGPFFIDSRCTHNILDQLLRLEQKVSAAESVVTRVRYDRNGNAVLIIVPEGNATAAVYDVHGGAACQGRFISRDPLGAWTGPFASGNAYGYVGGQSPALVDPLGLRSSWQPTAPQPRSNCEPFASAGRDDACAEDTVGVVAPCVW